METVRKNPDPHELNYVISQTSTLPHEMTYASTEDYDDYLKYLSIRYDITKCLKYTIHTRLVCNFLCYMFVSRKLDSSYISLYLNGSSLFLHLCDIGGFHITIEVDYDNKESYGTFMLCCLILLLCDELIIVASNIPFEIFEDHISEHCDNTKMALIESRYIYIEEAGCDEYIYRLHDGTIAGYERHIIVPYIRDTIINNCLRICSDLCDLYDIIPYMSGPSVYIYIDGQELELPKTTYYSESIEPYLCYHNNEIIRDLDMFNNLVKTFHDPDIRFYLPSQMQDIKHILPTISFVTSVAALYKN